MEEYRIDLKVRNNLILNKIESLGFSSPYDFCSSCKLSYVSFLRFVNMKVSIFDTSGNLKPFIRKLCDQLDCLPEEIFSANQMEVSLESNKRTLKVREAEMKFLLFNEDNQKLLEDKFSLDQRNESIDSVISCLTPREQKVINMRYGLGEYVEDHTLEQVGQEFGVNKERIRQIEQKALRKLRHPSKSDQLRDFLQE